MKFELSPFARDKILAGGLLGQNVFSSLVKDTSNAFRPTVVFLDFKDVQVATGSFLRESVFAYRNHVRTHYPMLYPVVSNPNQSVLDEFLMLLQLRDEALITCVLDRSGRVSAPRIIGTIDGKQQEALREVIKRNETDAPTLAKLTPDQKPTVWNNRLSALVMKGLIMEVGNEKTKRYRSVLEGMVYGS